MTTSNEIDSPQPFGTLLRRRREKAGLTQKELAQSAGISAATVRDLEQLRSRGARDKTVRALASALDLSAGEADELAAAAATSGAATVAGSGGGGAEPAGNPANSAVSSILGPLNLQTNGSPTKLGSQGQRTVVGLLALHANTAVMRTDLVDALWPDEPPESAVNVIQTSVARLRRLLGPPAHLEGGLAIRSVVGGYVLEATPTVLDVVAFDESLEAAHRLG